MKRQNMAIVSLTLDFTILILFVSLSGFNISQDMNRSAQSIEDLKFVLGSNFTYFVSTYWIYLRASCEHTASVLEKDKLSGKLQRFCQYFPLCPRLHQQQSCMVQTVATQIRSTCCLTTENETRLLKRRPRRLELQRCKCGKITPSPRIIGGTETRRGEFPWIAMLIRDGAFTCAAVIVDSQHAITAAHCFESSRPYHTYKVIAGKYFTQIWKKEIQEQEVRVADFVMHENFNSRMLWNDIAVIKFDQPFTWSNYVEPACLPTSDTVIGDHCTVAGWGDINPRSSEVTFPSVLMKVTIRAYDAQSCMETFWHTSRQKLITSLHQGTMCAANDLMGAKDACQADSGGPLMCVQQANDSQLYYSVFGLVSNGNGCALPGEPGFYTNVKTYMQWIYDTIDAMSRHSFNN